MSGEIPCSLRVNLDKIIHGGFLGNVARKFFCCMKRLNSSSNSYPDKKVKFLKPVINFFRAVLLCQAPIFAPPSSSYTNFSQKKLEKLDLVVYLS